MAFTAVFPKVEIPVTLLSEWETIDLTSLSGLEIPSDVTGVLIEHRCVPTSGYIYGVASVGDSTFERLQDSVVGNSRSRHPIFVPLNAQRQVRLYRANAAVRFFVAGFTGTETTYVTPTSIASRLSGVGTHVTTPTIVDVSDLVPEEASAILVRLFSNGAYLYTAFGLPGQNLGNGSAQYSPKMGHTTVVIPLNEERKFAYKGTNFVEQTNRDVHVIGYMREGAVEFYEEATLHKATEVDTWEKCSGYPPNAVLLLETAAASGLGNRWNARTPGDTFEGSADTSISLSGFQYLKTDENGEFEIYANLPEVIEFRVLGHFVQMAAKKIKLADDTRVVTANGVPANVIFPHFAFYSGELRVKSADDFPDILCAGSNLIIVNGVGEVNESIVTHGDWENLEVGTKGDLHAWDDEGNHWILAKNVEVIEG